MVTKTVAREWGEGQGGKIWKRGEGGGRNILETW